MKNSGPKEAFKTTIGGQALIEGVMMRGPGKTAIAVRKPDGDIHLRVDKDQGLQVRMPIFKLPIFRGVYALVSSLKIGVGALTYSASFWEEEEEAQESEGLVSRIFGDRSEDLEMGLSVLTSFLIAFVVFMALPNLLANFLSRYTDSSLALNLFEGLLRIIIFFIYLIAVSRIDDIYRVFQYHGAEHKSIACYEHGEDLTVENVMGHSRLHPRCGTSFLFMVMVVSVLVLSFFGWPNPLQRLLIRLIMLPVIAGISYEINRLVGRSDSILSQVLRWPGLEIQRLATVKEPDPSQVEVAIESLKAVIPEEEGADKW